MTLFSTIASVVTTSVPPLSDLIVVVATEILLIFSVLFPLLVLSLLGESSNNWFLVIFTSLILIPAFSDLGVVDTEILLMVSVFALLGGSCSNWFLVILISLILILLLLWLLFLRRLLNNRFTRSWRMGIGSLSVLTHFFDGKTRIFLWKKFFFVNLAKYTK